LRTGEEDLASTKRLIPFLIALAVFGLGFLLLDTALMSMQGLTLMFEK